MQITVNGKPHEIAAGATLAELQLMLGINPAVCVAEINGKIITPVERESYLLQAGDLIELVTIVGGG